MRYNEALKEMQFKRQKRFVLYGEEVYLKDTFINAAKAISSSIVNYYPGDEVEAKSTLFSRSLFEEDQLIILNYFDEMKVVGFKDIIPRCDSLLLIVFSEKANIKTKTLTDVIGLCVPVRCGKMSEYGQDYPAWLVSKAAEKGYTFIDDAENALFKKVGPDMCLLFKELEKLMVFKDQLNTISLIDIEKIVSFSAIGSTYEILELLLKKDIPKALKALDLYLKNSDDIEGLVFFLVNYFEKLYRMVLLASSGVSADGIGSILNINPIIIKSKYLSRAQSFGKDKLARIIASLVDLEVGLRMTAMKENLLYKFIFSFN